MPQLKLILGPDEVNAYVAEHDLEILGAELDAILLQGEGMSSGRSCVMLAFTLWGGQKVMAKTSFHLFNAAVRACRGALQNQGLWDREELD